MPKDRLEKLRTKVFTALLARTVGISKKAVEKTLKEIFEGANLTGFRGFLRVVAQLGGELKRLGDVDLDIANGNASFMVMQKLVEASPESLVSGLSAAGIRDLVDVASTVLNMASEVYSGKYGMSPMDAARPTARRLYEAVSFDLWPDSPAAIADFWLVDQRHYEAIYYPVRAAEITVENLDQVLGDPFAITELVNSMPSNPHKEITFGPGELGPARN